MCVCQTSMGNIPPSAFTLPATVGNIAVSTRSEPIGGFVVARELGLVFGNSQAYSNRAEGEAAQRLAQAISMMTAEAQKLGANAVLGVHIEVKEYAKTHAVCQAYGTAVTVAPRQ